MTTSFTTTAPMLGTALLSQRRDERAGGKTDEFHYEGGIRDFVAHVNGKKDPIHAQVVYFENDEAEGRGSVEVALQWNSSYVESVFSFANNINTHEGGSHLSGFAAALTTTMNKFARDDGLKPKRRRRDDVQFSAHERQ